MAPSRRILILSASVGAGHMRAAQAVELALREISPDTQVQNVDILTLTNGAFRKVYGSAYLDLVNKAPHVLGYFYDMMDRPRGPDSKRDKLRLALERLNLKKLLALLTGSSWDVVVNTHFLGAEIIASLRRAGQCSLPQMTVTTDFETHRLWVNEPCDLYTTATDEGAAYLKHWGVPDAHVRVTGIPIHPAFSHRIDRAATRKKFGVSADSPLVLQLAGGFGVGPVEQLVQAVLQVQTPIELMVVAGKNEQVRADLQCLAAPARHVLKVVGFTTEIDELMAMADVVLSKPGGLTTSEVLARGAAMVVVNPIPGQESRNSDYLLEQGAAIKINNIGTLAMKLGLLLGDAAKLQSLRDNATRIARPRAAYDVAELALALAAEKRTPSLS